MNFKLNTQTRSWGRVKGWNSTTDLEDTVKETLRFHPDQKLALIEAIKAELVIARAKLEKCRAEIRSPRAIRGTRTGRAIGSRFDRAHNKTHALESALDQLAGDCQGLCVRSPGGIRGYPLTIKPVPTQ